MLIAGWDTIQEAWHWHASNPLAETMERAKQAAQAARMNGEGVAAFDLSGERFIMHATGAKGGVAYRFENDNVIFMIRSTNCDWGVQVRYLSAGLWEHGWAALHDWVERFIAATFERSGDEPVRVSRADWAYDFYAPGLTAEFSASRLREHLVCHSSVKARGHAKLSEGGHDEGVGFSYIGTSARDETVTVGSMKSLQVTLYDKGQEITDASGKTWMADLWAQRNDGIWTLKDMWRLEVRMSSDWLKKRNVNTVAGVREYRAHLLTEALYRIRVASFDDGVSCIRNRAVHPLWSEAIRQSGAGEALPIGRKVSGRRDNLLDTFARQLAGSIRSSMVLDEDDPSDEKALQVLLRRVEMVMKEDPDAARKEKAARDRYEFIDEAR